MSPKPSKSAVKAPKSAPPAGKSSLPLAELDALAAWLAKAPVNEVEVEKGGLRLWLSKSATSAAYGPVAAPQSAATPSPAKQAADNTANSFTSPMVGTFYAAASPDSQPFVKVGDSVKIGQTLCIIEAMKTMNQVAADRSGIITKILIKDANPVEYGQPLFVIE